MVKARKGGLSRRNRDRLAQFAEEDARRELFELPDCGFAERHKITQQMERLVDAIVDGMPPSAVNNRHTWHLMDGPRTRG